MSACWFVAVACSDDEDRKPNAGDAGEGGDDGGGGKAGTPSIGGNMSQGGKAGMSSGGTAGNATAGETGESGSGTGGTGEAGSGGIVAGAGGEGGDAGTSPPIGGAGGEGPIPGGGGEAGALTGGGGEGGAPVEMAKSCVGTCEDDTDCVDENGFPKNCNDVTKVCDLCVADADCAPEQSLWVAGCETTAECNDPMYVCADFRGNTYCAVLDDPQNGAGCTDLSDDFESTEATLHEGGAAVSVCVLRFSRCFDGRCEQSCETLGCLAKEGDTCNPVSGRCECQNSTECGDGLACIDNLCTECAIDDDCAANPFGQDKCVAGKCGCADVSTCTGSSLPDATAACQ